MNWELFWVLGTFSVYLFIAWRSRVKSTEGFYVAGHDVPAFANGMATGADWMSAASFISMAGIIAFTGYAGSAYLLGWTGGYVLLALLLAPYLRKFGAYTVPDFVGDRYYSDKARVVALVCAIFVSLTYISGQMLGVGIVFSRFLGVDVSVGVVVGAAIVFVYSTLGGMKGITWTQVAQYCVMICAYIIPAVAISWQFTGNPIPQLAMGATVLPGQLGVEPGTTVHLLQQLDLTLKDLGFAGDYTSPPAGGMAMLNMFLLTFTLMVGTAGLPHVIIRFYTTKTVRAARWSAFWALLCIGLLYTTAPSVAVFARANLIHTIHGRAYAEAPGWFRSWEDSGLIAWVDKDGDGRVRIAPGAAMQVDKRKARYLDDADGDPRRGPLGQRLVDPVSVVSANDNELYVHRDIMVLANPQIANLPAWVIGLVVAGGLAAALSTAAGLLLVISSSISHDLMKRTIKPDMGEKEELRWARVAAGGAVVLSAIVGIYPPAFVAQTVAFAFGLAAASFFPAIILGIFSARTTREGAIAGMVTGIIFTGAHILLFTDLGPDAIDLKYTLGIKSTGIGAFGMALNFAVTLAVSRFTPPPPQSVQDTVEDIRYPLAEEGFHPDQPDHRLPDGAAAAEAP
jgi:cation/acetate symporter